MKILRLPFTVKRPILACGADMKGAFSLAVGDKAYLDDGFGDLGDADNLALYECAVKALLKRLKVTPKVVACDMHPGYFSTRFARNFSIGLGAGICRVQHHEAHIAAAIVDNRIKDSVIGVAFDGTGYGPDGRIWGGEFFSGNAKKFERMAHLEYIACPGADAAIRQPWRMAVSYLYKAGGPALLKSVRGLKRTDFVKAMIDKNVNSPLGSSAGRLFDAVASMILDKDEADYEAQLPIELEKMASPGVEGRYDFNIKGRSGLLTLSADSVIKGVVKDLSDDIDRGVISAKFHNSVASVIVRVALRISRLSGISKAVLSGGVFQNRYLTDRVRAALHKRGFSVYTHRTTSTTDAGIPLGQIAIARLRHLCV